MQISEITNFFIAADRNHDGKLTAKELKKAVGSQTTNAQKVLGKFLNEKGKVDSSKFNLVAQGDKKISQEELIALLTSTDEEDNVTLVDDNTLNTRLDNIASLGSIDTNNDGKFTASEILKAYRKAVESNNDKMIEMLTPYITTTEKGKTIANTSLIRMLADGKGYLKASDFYQYEKPDVDEKNYDKQYKNLDINGDGRITAAEMKKLYENAATDEDTKAFIENFMTKNAKGKTIVDNKAFRVVSGGKKYITLSDLKSINTNVDTYIHEDEVAGYLKQQQEFMAVDNNGDGRVSLGEIKKTAKNSTTSELANYFNKLVSSKEQKRIFKLLANGKSYISSNDILKYDTNNDGKLSADEIKVLNKTLGGITLPN